MNRLRLVVSQIKTVVGSLTTQYWLSHLFLLHIPGVLKGLDLSVVSVFAHIRFTLSDFIIHSHAQPPVFDT